MTDSLTVRDNRTGAEYEIPITDGTIKAADLGQIKLNDDEPGLATYDPGFVNTASCRSAITYIDGEKGILEYRGYPIEQLAEKSNFLEVAYLLIHGELPSKEQYDAWVHEITFHTFVHENVKGFMQGFRYDAHPMGMLMASVGALSTFYPESSKIADPDNRHIQIVRMIAKMPTLGAWAFRHAQGKPYVYPDNELSYAENFLSMLFKMSETKYSGDPRIVKALDTLFILHADHEQNCSTNAVRLGGLLAGRPVLRRRGRHRRPLRPAARRRQRGRAQDAAPDRLGREHPQPSSRGVKNKADDVRLMGFGHRVYKNFDPAREDHQEGTAHDVFAGHRRSTPNCSTSPCELEKIALEDEYFIKRKLYPNVDFYSGLIYEALELPAARCSPSCSRSGGPPGWLAQWLELVQDKEQKIARPKQIYTGPRTLDFVPAEERWA